jgi:1-acyl-sn-glycerol-3-phosphate acyltransferase
MSGNSSQESRRKKPVNLLVDILVTFICWGYFIFAFLFFFSFFYLGSYCFAADREKSFQYLNHRFFSGFLWLLRALTPRYSWHVDPQIADIRGAILVCNHLSYLDPLLFLSLLPRNKTIVKTRFFRAPVFGRIVDISGYLPSTTEGIYASKMIQRVEKMGVFFKSGGNLFVFPEGTRNLDASVDALHKGVFKIARMAKCPIHVLGVSGTDTLFTPGQFFFNTRQKNSISLAIIETIQPDRQQGKMTVSILEERVRHAFQKQKMFYEGAVA